MVELLSEQQRGALILFEELRLAHLWDKAIIHDSFEALNLSESYWRHVHLGVFPS